MDSSKYTYKKNGEGEIETNGAGIVITIAGLVICASGSGYIILGILLLAIILLVKYRETIKDLSGKS